ncbi:unnamed protein product, partial [Porites evermanni]
EETQYFGNNLATPFSKVKFKTWLTFDEKINILLLDMDSRKACNKWPNRVQKNACFVIDHSQLKK